jgi:histidine kinase
VALSEARALQLRMNPHFLFNAFECVGGAVRSQADRLAYCGSRAFILAIQLSRDRSSVSSNSGGDRQRRDCAICAVAASVRIQYRQTRPHFEE